MVIKWNPSLAIGVPTIDQEHRELFARANRLVEAMKASNLGEVARLMSFLGEYVVEHFRGEEELMLHHGYPRFALHKAAHDRFIADYGEMGKKLGIPGAMTFVAVQLSTWLGDWLSAHVSGTDRAFAEWLHRSRHAEEARTA